MGGSVVDLGDQLLYSIDHATTIFSELKATSEREQLSAYQQVTKVYQLLGLGTRKCIDFSGNADYRADLNYSIRSHPELQSAFDLVTNQGFSEHVFNQMSTFECIHHVCKPGGLMFHVLPCQGWADGGGWGHGFFQYQPNFFRHLARANDYKIIDLQISVYSPSPTIYSFSAEMYPLVSNLQLIEPDRRNELDLNHGQFLSLLVLL